MEHVRAAKKEWMQSEAGVFRREQAPAISRAIARTLKTCQAELNPLMNQHPSRWDAKKVETALTRLREQKETASEVLQHLPNRPYKDQAVEAARVKGGEALRASIDLCDVAIAYVEAGEKLTRKDEKRLEVQFGKVDDLGREWEDLLETLPREKER
jgi:hypothetical protein